MVAQLQRLRLRVLREGLARADSHRKQHERRNRRHLSGDGPATRVVRADSMRNEIDHTSCSAELCVRCASQPDYIQIGDNKDNTFPARINTFCVNPNAASVNSKPETPESDLRVTKQGRFAVS